MANYIPTSCTDAYIKISNTSAKCGHHIAPASRVLWLKTQYIFALWWIFLSLFLILLSTRKVCGKNHKAKLTSQSHAAAHSDRSVSTLREKVHCATVTVLRSSLQLFILQQWGKNVTYCQDQPLLSIYPEGYAGL